MLSSSFNIHISSGLTGRASSFNFASPAPSHATALPVKGNLTRWHSGRVQSKNCRNLIITAQRKGSSDENNKQLLQTGKGTIVGAASLIVGTSVGSGILALPEKTSAAGVLPSAVSIVVCWVFLVIEALLLAEINIWLRKKRKKDEGQEEGELEVLSLRTMAQETLGEWGGNLATITYLFLAYTSVVAYASKSGEVLSRMTSLPASISGNLFTVILALLILLGGTSITDRVNQWLTFTMIGLLLMIETLAVSFAGGSGSFTESNWDKVPQTIPVIIFSLVYHDIAPVLCAYLGGDLQRVRLSIVIGSLVPLISLLVWDNIALGLPHIDGIDPIDLIFSNSWSSMLPIVEAFSLLAVGTSLIGTLLGFSQFFIEQLMGIFFSTSSLQETENTKSIKCDTGDRTPYDNMRIWWQDKSISLLATCIVIFPSMLISTAIPDAFTIATDFAGGYCMMILYGVLPPAMAWAMLSPTHHQSQEEEDEDEDDDDEDENNMEDLILSRTAPVLIGAGLFSCALVTLDILRDLPPL